MTLMQFDPEALDVLALRLLDIAALVRKMANDSRENDLGNFQLHGNKINEWLGHLEGWAHEGRAKLETTLIKERGKARAQSVPHPAPEPRSKGRSGSGKKR